MHIGGEKTQLNNLKIHSNSFPVNFLLPVHSAEKHLFPDEEATDRACLEVEANREEVSE